VLADSRTINRIVKFPEYVISSQYFRNIPTISRSHDKSQTLQCSNFFMQSSAVHEPQTDLVVTHALLPMLVGKLLVKSTSVVIDLIASF